MTPSRCGSNRSTSVLEGGALDLLRPLVADACQRCRIPKGEPFTPQGEHCVPHRVARRAADLLLGATVPITLGALDFTITPVLSFSTPFSATGSVTAKDTVGITQSAWAKAGFTYRLGGSPQGFYNQGCGSGIPSGSPFCTKLSKGPGATAGASLSVSAGLSLSLTAAIDYVGPDGPVMGPTIELAPTLAMTLQSATPVWSVGLDVPLDLGVVFTWNWGPIGINLSAMIKLYEWKVTIAHSIEVNTTSLPPPLTNTPYSATVKASGGATPYTWAVTKGSLPAGLSLDTSTGGISGTPTTTGTSSFTVTVTDSLGSTAQATLSLSVSTPAGVLTWSAPVSIDPSGYNLNSVSCPTATFCVAVDGYGNAVVGRKP